MEGLLNKLTQQSPVIRLWGHVEDGLERAETEAEKPA